MLDAPRQIAKRRLLTAVSLSAAGLILPFDPVVAARHEEKQPEVTPPEDLMREHGVLNRILLIYDEHIRRLDAKQGSSSERPRSRQQNDPRDLVRRSNSDLGELLALDFCLLGGLACFEGDVPRSEPDADLLQERGRRSTSRENPGEVVRNFLLLPANFEDH